MPADAPRPLVAEQVWRARDASVRPGGGRGTGLGGLPGPALDRSEFLIACAITAGMLVVGLLGHLRHHDRWLIGVLRLGYLAVAALLRHAERRVGQRLPSPRYTRGLAGRFGTRRQLIVGLAAMAATCSSRSRSSASPTTRRARCAPPCCRSWWRP